MDNIKKILTELLNTGIPETLTLNDYCEHKIEIAMNQLKELIKNKLDKIYTRDTNCWMECDIKCADEILEWFTYKK